MGAKDNLYSLSTAQALTDTAASEYTLDLAVTYPQIGVGVPVYLCMRTQVAGGGSSPTIIIAVEIADDTNFSGGDLRCLFAICDSDGSALAMDSDTRFTVAGAWIYRAPLPYEVAQRHLRLYYTLAGSSPTLTIDAWLQTQPPQSDFDKQVFVSPVGNP